MKRVVCIIPLLFLLIGCNPASRRVSLSEVRWSYAKDMVRENQKTIAWAQLTDSIYRIADTNEQMAIVFVNNMTERDKLSDVEQTAELYFIKGDIYTRMDSLDQAMEALNAALNTDSMSPKYLAARAAIFVKQHQMNRAFDDLSKAAAVNYDYNWHIGNYYEIIGAKDSALAKYTWLYRQDTTIYANCKHRIIALTKPKPVFLKELVFKPRDNRILLLSPAK